MLLTQVFASLAGLYFTGVVVLNLAQAHLETIAGIPSALATMLDRLIPAVICFVVAANATSVGNEVAKIMGIASAQDAAGVFLLSKLIVEFIVNVILYSIGASLAVGFATGALAAQLSAFTNQPGALSNAWIRIGLTVLTGMLTLLSVTLSNAMIQAIHS